MSAGRDERRNAVCREKKTKDDCKGKWGNQGECEWRIVPGFFGIRGRKMEDTFACSYSVNTIKVEIMGNTGENY